MIGATGPRTDLTPIAEIAWPPDRQLADRHAPDLRSTLS